MVRVMGKAAAGPLWQGPQGDGPNGGVTQGLLAKFLACRERFRVRYVLGLRARERWTHTLGYGSMWHVCEEALAGQGQRWKGYVRNDGKYEWELPLQDYVMEQCRRHPMQREEITKWYGICRLQFPLYVEHWAGHPDVTGRTPLLQETAFDVPYKLPGGRTVRLRGKWDAVDLIDGGVWLQENKTKGDVDRPALERQLTFDLQTMLYLTALDRAADHGGLNNEFHRAAASNPIRGVRYNVVRRPLSGGKGTIKQKEPSKANPRGESLEEYHARLAQYIKDEPGHYFMRWRAEVAPHHVERFRREFLDPVLEQLCDWYNWVSRGYNPFGQTATEHGIVGGKTNYLHWRHPFGVYNPTDEGRETDEDQYLAAGDTTGLERATVVFPELEGELR